MSANKNSKKWVLIKKKPKELHLVRKAPVSVPSRLVRPYSDGRGNVTCPSCGNALHETKLPEHLAQVHGFSKAELQLLVEDKRESKSPWVKVLQGGLPSLGKKR